MAPSDFFKRKPAADAASGSSARLAGSMDAVEKVRTRTRQRLIGAVLLLTLGVIGSPLLFESQPRPIPLDIPIEIPKPDGAPALSLPTPRADSASALPQAASESTVASGIVTRDAPSEPMPAPESVAASTPASAPSVVPAASAAAAAVSASAAKVATAASKPAVATESAASATPSAKVASAAGGSPRFVVQVGAFADPASARGVRLKMEKLGMKTYTQVAETSTGKRIRVRLGPFETRAEADKAQAKSKEAGIAAVVLKL